MTRKNTFSHFAPSHCIGVSGQGSTLYDFPTEESVNNFSVYPCSPLFGLL